MLTSLLRISLAAALVAAPLVPAPASAGALAAHTPAQSGAARAVAAADDAEGAAADEAGATTWALRPADGSAPDGRVSLRHRIEPGGSGADTLALTNFSTRPATFAVYASDGVVTADGGFDLVSPDVASTRGGAWVSVAHLEGATERAAGGWEVPVGGESTVLIPVQIDVPSQATPGDHPAGIVAELVSGEDSGVQLVSRVGVRVHLRVTGDIVADMAPADIAATYTPSWNPFAPGTVTIDYAVVNAGNVRLGAETVTTLDGPLGVARDDARSEQREILPGDQLRASIELPAWPLFLRWGDITATPTVVGEDEVDAVLASASAQFSVWTIPWSQLALLAVIGGVIVLVPLQRRRAKARVQAQIDAAVAAATGVTGTPAEQREGAQTTPSP